MNDLFKEVPKGIARTLDFHEGMIRIERNPKRDIQILRGLVDGQYVFLHVYQKLHQQYFQI